MRRFLLCAAIVFTLVVTVCAQTNTGTIVGQVFDPQKAVIPGAEVRVTNAETNYSQTMHTTGAGMYNFSALQPGTYRLEVQKPGFGVAIIESIQVLTAQTTTADVVLAIGIKSDSVQVTADVPLLTPDSPTVSTTIEHKMLDSLPYNDQASLGAVMLSPGVQGDPQFAGGVQSENPGIYLQPVAPGASLAVGGGRPGSASILVDGSDNSLTSYPRTGVTFSSTTALEMTVQQNGLPAQYGRTGGGIINQSTRGGTKNFHGELNYLHSDPSLDASNYGTPFERGKHLNRFGAMFSGPVIIPHVYDGKAKTFFFVSVEPTRQNDLNWSRSRIATPEELSGEFNDSLEMLNQQILKSQGLAAALAAQRINNLYYQFALNSNEFPTGNKISKSKYNLVPNNDLSAQLAQNKVAQYIFGYMPTPQYSTKYVSFYRADGMYANDGTNAYTTRGVFVTDNRFTARVDHTLANNDHLTARYTRVPVDGVRYGMYGPVSPVNTIPTDDVVSHNIVLSESHAFKSSVNEVRATYTRANQLRTPVASALSEDWGAMLGLTPAALGVGFPAFGGFPGGNEGSGGTVLTNGRSVDVNLGFADDYSFVRGNHAFKIGADIRFLQQNRRDTSNLYGGGYSFSDGDTSDAAGNGGNAYASFILGIINSYTVKSAPMSFYYRWRYYAGYIQDDWKARPNLTINLGLRYNLETPRYEKYDHQGTFDPNMAGILNGVPVQGGFVFAGQDGQSRYLWPINYKGVEPRIGLAYAPRSFMTVRASYGLVHTPLTGLGANVVPDLSSPVQSIKNGTGGQNSNAYVNYMTNPVGAIAGPIPLAGPLFTFPSGTNLPYIPQNSAVPYVQLYSVSAQFQPWRKAVLETGYSGQHGVHLLSTPMDQNLPNFDALMDMISLGGNLSSRNIPNKYGLGLMTGLENMRPYPQFFNNVITSAYARTADSHYNSFYTIFKQRLTKGLNIQSSFSWSKSIDDASSGSTDLSNLTDVFGFAQPQNPWIFPARERSLSLYDIPDKFTVAYNYDLPIGKKHALHLPKALNAAFGEWSTSGMFMRQSGYPSPIVLGGNGYFFSTIAGGAYASGGSAVQDMLLRPNVIPGIPLINPNWRSDPFGLNGGSGYINAAAFGCTSTGCAAPGSPGNPQFGDAPRTMGNLRNPATQFFNASVSKSFRVTERVRFNLRVNMINALNHTNFFLQGHTLISSYTPGTNTFLESASFGDMNQANVTPGREIQLSGRLSF